MTGRTREEELREIEEVTNLAYLIARHLGERQNQGGPAAYYEYADGRVRLRIMPGSGTPVEAEIVRERKYVPVLQNNRYKDHPGDGLKRYNPGAWTGYLRSLEAEAAAASEREKIEKQAREEESRLERFSPVDDSSLFPKQRARPERK